MFKLLKFAVLSLFLVLSLNLSGQIHYAATPSNTAQVTAAIIDDYQHLISINSNQLEGHLLSLVHPNIYCPTCPNTSLVVQENAPGTLHLSWASIVNADFYEIAYINLSNGASNSFIEYGTSLSLNSLPYGPYALSIATYSTTTNGVAISFVDIIVEETPMLFPTMNNNDCNCATDSDLADYSWSGDILNWTPEMDQRYEFDLFFGEDADVNMKIELSTIPVYGDHPYKFTLECWENIKFEGANTFFSTLEDALDIQVYFKYDDNYHLEFITGPDHTISTTSTVKRCSKPRLGHRLIASEKSDLPITIHPNPTQDKLWISSPSTSKTPSAISIYNHFGQQVLQHDLNSNKELISISKLPAGMYFIEINSNDKATTQSFIKVN